jgi:hypothetical protein
LDQLIEGLQQFQIIRQSWRRENGIVSWERQLILGGLQLVIIMVGEHVRIMGWFFAFIIVGCSLPTVFGSFR